MKSLFDADIMKPKPNSKTQFKSLKSVPKETQEYYDNLILGVVKSE